VKLVDKRKKAEADKMQVRFRFFVSQSVGASVPLVRFYADVSILETNARTALHEQGARAYISLFVSCGAIRR